MKFYWVFAFLCILSACVKTEKPIDHFSFPDLQWIDLTHPFSSATLYWPNNPKGFIRDTLFEGMTDKGYYYSSFDFYAPEHGGTHLDAPIHFAENKLTVDGLELNQLIGNGIVIDVSSHASDSRDYQINVADVESWEKEHGAIPENTIVLFKTGYGKYYPDALTYFGTDKKGEEAIPLLHFPGIHPELATWLVKNRKIKAVGLDTPSIDFGQSQDFQTHRILLAENIPAFENVAHLDKLSATGFYVFALPMLLKDGSGAPLRIIAGVKK